MYYSNPFFFHAYSEKKLNQNLTLQSLITRIILKKKSIKTECGATIFNSNK